MTHKTFLTLATIASFALVTSAMAGPGHDHSGHGHDHAAESSEHAHGHDHGHGGHTSGKAGDFASTGDALADLKAALAEAGAAVEAGDLAAMDALFPRIESAGAYIHDFAKPASEDLGERFHASVDQMMAVFGEMHDVAHGTDQAAAKRLLKKANGSVMLVENFLAESDRAGNAEDAPAVSDHGHDHSYGSHSH